MKILIKLLPFAILRVLTLSARCLEKSWVEGHDILYADLG